jgi:hypothetical protein
VSEQENIYREYSESLEEEELSSSPPEQVGFLRHDSFHHVPSFRQDRSKTLTHPFPLLPVYYQVEIRTISIVEVKNSGKLWLTSNPKSLGKKIKYELEAYKEKRRNWQREAWLDKKNIDGFVSLTQLFGDRPKATDTCKVNNRLVSFQGDSEALKSIYSCILQ